MIKEPLVSVITPVYNGDKFIMCAIDSILCQSFVDFEYILIDDGSTDESARIISSYSDPRIRLLANGTNIGVAASKNRGISESRGKYIAFLDCDDMARPERLSEQVRFLEKHADFGLIGTWVEIIDETGKPTGNVWKNDAIAEKVAAHLLFHNYFAQSSVMLRKSALPAELFRAIPLAEDYDLWTRLVAVTKAVNLPKVLVQYRIHTNSTSRINADMMDFFVKGIIKDQLNTMGLNPNNEELQLHVNLGRCIYTKNKNFVSEVEKWLNKLLVANEHVRTYAKKEFAEIVHEIWTNSCATNAESSLFEIYKYITSRLTYLGHAGAVNMFEHTVAYLVKYFKQLIANKKLKKINVF